MPAMALASLRLMRGTSHYLLRGPSHPSWRWEGEVKSRQDGSGLASSELRPLGKRAREEAVSSREEVCCHDCLESKEESKHVRAPLIPSSVSNVWNVTRGG